MEVDLISLLNHPKVDLGFLQKKEDDTIPKLPSKIPADLIETYVMGQTLIKCLESFGESQRKLAQLSKEDSEKYNLLQEALKEAMQQAAQSTPSPLKLVVEKKDEDYSYRISYTPV